MIYYFYSKSDPKKEPIYSTHAVNKTQAIIFFKDVKDLSIDDFLKLYEVDIKK